MKNIFKPFSYRLSLFWGCNSLHLYLQTDVIYWLITFGFMTNFAEHKQTGLSLHFLFFGFDYSYDTLIIYDKQIVLINQKKGTAKHLYNSKKK